MKPYPIDLEKAAKFVIENANPIEEARLRAIIAGQPAGDDVIEAFRKEQSEEGGWHPFWSSEYISIDATCFRLAQLESLGVTEHQPVFEKALDFLEDAQQSSGHWEETPDAPDTLPPWLSPGDINSQVYLTANSLFWLAVSGRQNKGSEKASFFLEECLNDGDRLPGPLHAQWLAGGACYALDRVEQAERMVRPLADDIDNLPASRLAWMLTSLLIAGLSTEDELIQRAAKQLADLQQPDGQWSSEDGADFDVHTTLEAMRVFLWLST